MFNFEEQSELVHILAGKLVSSKFSLSTAESCTGGGIGQKLTAIPGSSAWYLGGIISYSNSLKSDLLKVPHETIESFGAVSEETAKAMALGVASVTNSDLSVSTTGIAGPDGGSKDKPVGTVCFGWSIAGKIHTETIYFTGDRDKIRQQSVRYSLERLIQLI